MRTRIEKLFLWVGLEQDAAVAVSWMVAFIIVSWSGYSVSNGVMEANDPNKCRVQSIGDVAVSPLYAIGCVIGKDRFDVKLN